MSFGRKLRRQAGHGGGKELRLFELHSSDTLQELEESTRKAAPAVLADGVPFYASVSGYDNDPRELWEVPAVKELFERVIASGMIGLLGDNESIGQPGGVAGFIDSLGAFLLARGAVLPGLGGPGGGSFLTPDTMKEYRLVLATANEKVDQLVAEGRS